MKSLNWHGNWSDEVGMVVGRATIDLHLPESDSLKGKRHLLQRIKDRVRNKFNVSIAEVGDNDIWQRCQLGVVVVSNDSSFANEVLSKVVSHVQGEQGVVMLDYSIEIS